MQTNECFDHQGWVNALCRTRKPSLNNAVVAYALKLHYSPKKKQWMFLFKFVLLGLMFPTGLQNVFLLCVNIITSEDAALQGHNCRAVKMTLLPLAVGQPSFVMIPPAVLASTNGSKSLQLLYSGWKLTLCPELTQGQLQNPVYKYGQIFDFIK